MMSRRLKEYNVENSLLPKEKCLFDNEYSQQDAIDVIWTYEAYWSLMWALGLIENNEVETPDYICDCKKANKLVSECKSFDEFKSKCKIRDIEEILDMLDLYYRYHWACVENSINPNTEIGVLNPDIVVERRRGLEWLISEESDWNYISLTRIPKRKATGTIFLLIHNAEPENFIFSAFSECVDIFLYLCYL